MLVEKERAMQMARDDLSTLGIPKDLQLLRHNGVYHKQKLVGGSHTVVTCPPMHGLVPTTPETALSAIKLGEAVHLYVHIAFCETHCTFCHYDVLPYPGRKRASPERAYQVDAYLNALQEEMRMWAIQLAGSDTKVASLYIGGGTPTVLEGHELEQLFASLQSLFRFTPNADLCIESSPKTILAEDGAAKLRLLRDLGFTRLSFGGQSFDDVVLRRAARGYGAEELRAACAIANRVFANWNIDLIQGLYQGSLDEIWQNLVELSEILPPSVTYYNGRFSSSRPTGKQLETSPASFPNELDRHVGRALIWRQMRALGYTQTDGNRFIRNETFADSFKNVRTSVQENLIGIGSSAYSHVNDPAMIGSEHSSGYFFRNVVGYAEYVQRIGRKQFAIEEGLAMTPEEQLAASYAINLRSGRIDDGVFDSYREWFPHLWGHYERLVDKLTGLGLLEKSGFTLKLTRRGRLFEDEILSLFYSPSVMARLSRF